jgi:probable rRNA maturation factor
VIHLHNQQKRHPIRLKKLQKFLEPLPTLLKKEWPADLIEVDVIFVTPSVSARVHQEFFHDPSATDVMTFQHGEIIICPAIAQKQKKIEGLSFENELLTYIIHGVLHLCGWDDLNEPDFKAMQKKQSTLRQKLLQKSSPAKA